MKNKLNQNDLQFIQWLKEQLSEVELFVVKKDNAFSWTKDKKVLEENGGHDYKEEMIDFFIHDLMNNSKTYQYNIDSVAHTNLSEITDTLLNSVNNHTSTYLKLRMLDLFDGDDSFFLDMLSLAYTRNDTEFLLEIFKKGMVYLDDNRNNLLAAVKTYYKGLQAIGTVDSQTLQLSFINHIKASQINISTVELIQTYLKLFSDSDLVLLFNEFSIENEKLCAEIKPNAYSQISLSLQVLSMAKLDRIDIDNIISSLSNKDLNFPHFLIASNDVQNIRLLVEKQDKHSEEKVIMLFEQLIAQKYKWADDKKQNFNQLFTIVEQVNEMVHLDDIVEKGNDKHKKIKV